MNKELVKLKQVIEELIVQLKANVFYYDAQCVGELGVAELLFHNMTQDQLMDHVVRYILPHADKIRARDRHFFYKNRSLFAQLPEQRVSFYADYFMNHADDHTLMTMWQYFEVILRLVESYRKQK